MTALDIATVIVLTVIAGVMAACAALVVIGLHWEWQRAAHVIDQAPVRRRPCGHTAIDPGCGDCLIVLDQQMRVAVCAECGRTDCTHGAVALHEAARGL